MVCVTQPYNINVSHRGSASARVRVICLEAVKIYGNKPKKLFIKINTNNEIKIIEDPWLDEGPRSILNSMCNFLREELIVNENFLGINQNTGRVKINTNKDLIQFNDKFKFAEGSNTENKFVIILNKNCLFDFVLLFY